MLGENAVDLDTTHELRLAEELRIRHRIGIRHRVTDQWALAEDEGRSDSLPIADVSVHLAASSVLVHSQLLLSRTFPNIQKESVSMAHITDIRHSMTLLSKQNDREKRGRRGALGTFRGPNLSRRPNACQPGI